MVSSVCRSSESWFWTKQELQVSATEGSCIFLSWIVGWHTLLLSSVWAVIQQPWHAGVVMFLRVQNQREPWASFYECNCSGLSSPAEFPASLASASSSCWAWSQVCTSCFKHCLKPTYISCFEHCLKPTYHFSCIKLLQPTRFCSNWWERVCRCGLWPVR